MLTANKLQISINKKEKSSVIIFYLNKQVYAQQIINLVKVIDQEKLIKKVAYETIVFKHQQHMISIVEFSH